MKLVTTELVAYVTSSGDPRFRRYGWVAETAIDEILAEMSGAKDEALAGWIIQFGTILTWAGTGDDSLLPDNVRDYLLKNHREMLAIEG